MSTISSGRRNRFLGAMSMLIMMSMSFLMPQLQVHATSGPTLWWPTNGAKVSGVQPFKALLENQPLTSYKMYWQVENGQLNLMQDNYTDSPHKEASVDLSGWTWKGSGPYAINFVAKDQNDSPISQQSINIYTNGQTATTVNPTPTTPTQTTPTAILQSQPVTIPPSTTVQAPASTLTVSESAPYTISILVPSNGNYVSGLQTVRAQVQNLASSKYDLYWQVDGDTLNQMTLSSQGYYESQIDFSGWNWKGSGPYALNFVAKNANDNTLIQQSINIYVNKTTQTSQTASLPTPANSSYSITLSNPSVSAMGTQTLSAQITNLTAAQYSMYWQVDKGTLNQMTANGQVYSASIDFSGWNWKGSGPYTINFVAKDQNSNILAQKSIDVYSGSQSTAVPTITTTPTAQPNPTVTTTPTAQPVSAPALNSSSNPLVGAKLWVNPNSDAANYVKRSDVSAYQKQMMSKVAQGAETQWFSTGWINDMYSAINNYVSTATNQGSVATMVLYDIPYRDCGQYSAGGSDATTYMNTVNSFASGIGSRKAAVIVEPDALSLTSCLNSTQLQQRYDLLKYAVQKLKSNPNTAVYIDIGHPGWLSASDAAQKLSLAGVQYADGFALNTSNFNTDAENTTYGTAISNALAQAGISNKHFVADRGRNGNGSNGEWCNPSGRALGYLPTTNTGNPLIDAFLWIKGPSGSDGNCNGGPSAGTFWPDYAIGLAAGAHW